MSKKTGGFLRTLAVLSVDVRWVREPDADVGERDGRGNARAEYQHVRAVKRGTGACHVRERSERGVQL